MLTLEHDSLRGHWGGWGCACPTPNVAPANLLTACQLAEWDGLREKIIAAPQDDGWNLGLTAAERDRLIALHAIAYPDWRYR